MPLSCGSVVVSAQAVQRFKMCNIKTKPNTTTPYISEASQADCVISLVCNRRDSQNIAKKALNIGHVHAFSESVL